MNNDNATVQTTTATDASHHATNTRTDRFFQPWHEVPWLGVLGLGAIALTRPAIHVWEFMTGGLAPSWVPFGITVVITMVWVAVAGFQRWRRPMTLLLATGVMYALLTVALGGVGGFLLMGGLQGPLADPLSLGGILVTNLIWGAVAGTLTTLLQRLLGVRIRPWRFRGVSHGCTEFFVRGAAAGGHKSPLKGFKAGHLPGHLTRAVRRAPLLSSGNAPER